MVRFIALLLLMTSCQIGPRYIAPGLNSPDNWKAPTCEAETTSGPWWEIFDDPLLDQLECQAIQHNFNLMEAMARVQEARATACVEGADRYPQLSLGPGYSSTSQLFEFFGPRTVLPQLNLSRRLFRIHQLWYSLPINVNYELDLWGKLKSRAQAACLSAEAEQWALQAAALSLSAEVATAYFSLRTLDRQLDLVHEVVLERQLGYEIAEEQYSQGLVPQTDLMRASRELASVEAKAADLQRQRGIEENRIAQLLGKSASTFSLSHHPLPDEPPPCAPAGLPATVLAQRPDIAEAERRIASQNKRVGAAKAARLPSIQLTASLGSLSPTIGEFMEWISRYLTFGVVGDQTLFDGGRKGCTVRAECARLAGVESAYRDTVLTALREVEDALYTLDRQAEQGSSLEREVAAALCTAQLDRGRYKQGLTGYLEVVESESSALEVEQSQIELQGMRYLSTVQLIKALGGRWGPCGAESPL